MTVEWSCAPILILVECLLSVWLSTLFDNVRQYHCAEGSPSLETRPWLEIQLLSGAYSAHQGPLFSRGRKTHIPGKSRKMTFPLDNQRRKWNQGQVLSWHHGNSFPNHLSESRLSFLLHASRCNLNRIFDMLLFWGNRMSRWFSSGHKWLAPRCYNSF